MVTKKQKLAKKQYKEANPELFPDPVPAAPKDPNKKNKLKPKKSGPNDPNKPKKSSHTKHPLRVAGMKPGESCFICRAPDHIAKLCPMKSEWERNKANAVSGMSVHDDCKHKFLDLKAKRNYRFIIFKIEGQQVVVEKLGEPNQNYQEFADSLPPDQCRYAVFDFDFITNEKCQKSKIFFIAWSPETSAVRNKMVYASTKDRFKRELDGIQVELQATDPSEMSFDIVKSRAY